MMISQIAIFGAGGFGREVACWAQESAPPEGQYELVGFIDDEPIQGFQTNGNQIFTLARIVETFPGALVVIAVADPKARERIARRVLEAGLAFGTLVHQSVVRSRYVELGMGSIICAGCILTTDIVLGNHVQINLNSTIGHDAVLGDFATLGPGVHISGCVNIGKRVFIGTGAVIINGSTAEPLLIGDDSMIGAGSCVIRSLPAASRVFGNPARPIPGASSGR
jgi:sugar O-acyltransferase (sialic acid O-acetyltransferase NeuD family)